MVGNEISHPMSGQCENDPDVNKTKSSHETVEDIGKILSNLLEIRTSYERGIQDSIDESVLLKSDVSRLKYVVETYEALKNIDKKLVITHAKWIEKKSMVGEDVKYSPKAFNAIMANFEEEQNIFKTKIEEMVATYPAEMVNELLKDFDQKIESTQHVAAFDQHSDRLTEAAKDKLDCVEVPIEATENVEKLILELLESKKKHQHIVNFFLATKGNTIQCNQIKESCRGLQFSKIY